MWVSILHSLKSLLTYFKSIPTALPAMVQKKFVSRVAKREISMQLVILLKERLSWVSVRLLFMINIIL